MALRKGPPARAPEGRAIASFECKTASAASVSSAVFVAFLALAAALASNLGSEAGAVAMIFIAVALVEVLTPLLATLVPATRSVCTLTETGILLRPARAEASRGRFLAWSGISRFSSKDLGMKAGRIYLYPRGALGLLRREVVQPVALSDYSLLFNLVSSRVGLY